MKLFLPLLEMCRKIMQRGFVMHVDELRSDLALRNKKGMSFILASVFIWTGILIVWLLPTGGVGVRNMYTFCLSVPLMPLSYLFSKLIKAEFSAKDNPLNKLGILFSMNQMLYILIVMWAFSDAPDKMVMVLAMVFGAHLLPFSWLYKSKAYLVMSIVVTLGALITGCFLSTDKMYLVPAVMLAFETVFTVWLVIENKLLKAEAVKPGQSCETTMKGL